MSHSVAEGELQIETGFITGENEDRRGGNAGIKSFIPIWKLYKT